MEHSRRLTGCMKEPNVRSASYKQDKPDEKSRNRKRLTLRERKNAMRNRRVIAERRRR